MSTQQVSTKTMTEDFPAENKELRAMMARLSKRLPGTMTGFGHLHHEATAEGALSPKVKELVALAIGITVRCNGCIAFHVHDALKAGATAQEVLEIIGVAIFMGGGPAVVYGVEAMKALEQFEAAGLS